jgi:hypothetical protein
MIASVTLLTPPLSHTHSLLLSQPQQVIIMLIAQILGPMLVDPLMKPVVDYFLPEFEDREEPVVPPPQGNVTEKKLKLTPSDLLFPVVLVFVSLLLCVAV